ncbi:hypothetical protein BC834DRAFT_418126 [Gloeopeniophorella convolvens]|nr:hypothetical protein BC834DRAFT_418126 [Gloeopeniophorella convolvens]
MMDPMSFVNLFAIYMGLACITITWIFARTARRLWHQISRHVFDIVAGGFVAARTAVWTTPADERSQQSRVPTPPIGPETEASDVPRPEVLIQPAGGAESQGQESEEVRSFAHFLVRSAELTGSPQACPHLPADARCPEGDAAGDAAARRTHVSIPRLSDRSVVTEARATRHCRYTPVPVPTATPQTQLYPLPEAAETTSAAWSPSGAPDYIHMHLRKVYGAPNSCFRLFESSGAAPLSAPRELSGGPQPLDVFVHRCPQGVQAWLCMGAHWQPLGHGAMHPVLPEHRFFMRAGERARWVKQITFEGLERKKRRSDGAATAGNLQSWAAQEG